MPRTLGADSYCPVPPAEPRPRWPARGVVAVAVGLTGWLLTELPARFPPDFVGWSRERVALVVLAPEVAACLAGAAVVLAYALARRFCGPWLAALAAGVFALALGVAQPVPVAQTAAAFLILAAVGLVMRCVDDPAPGVGILAGLCLGLLPAFSRTGTVGALAIVGWLLWQTARSGRCWSVAVGAVGPLAWLAATRAAAWIDHWREFFRPAGRHLRHWGDFTGGIVLPEARGALWWTIVLLGAAGAAALVLDRRRRDEGVLLVAVVVAMAVCHVIGTGSMGAGAAWIMPLPFLAVGAAALWARLIAGRAPVGRLAVAAAVTVQIGLGGVALARIFRDGRAVERVAAEVRTFAEQHIAPGGWIVGPATLARGLATDGRWHFVDARSVAGSDKSTDRRHGPWRRPDAAKRSLQLDELRTRAAGAPVYLFARATDPTLRALRGRASVEVMGEIKTPPAARHPTPSGSEKTKRRGQTPRETPADTAVPMQIVKIVFAAE